MMVIFTSQSDKNALKTTRWILDAFANRIGNDTWQTIITEDGLQMVKRLLRRHATKSMSVSCRWIRSRTHSQLLWIVGDRNRFNEEGYVPVNSTQKDVAHRKWENDWQYLPEIKALAAMAGLLHDWGKANTAFQKLLKKKKDSDEQFRHEWLSCKLLEGLVWQTEGHTDEEWLALLQNGKINEKKLEKWLQENVSEKITKLPSVASMLCWLIMSHHRLPILDTKEAEGYVGNVNDMPDFEGILSIINGKWGYQKAGVASIKIASGLQHSDRWQKQLQKWSTRLLAQRDILQEIWKKGNVRLLLYYARVSLMLSDYTISADGADKKWPDSCSLYANTDKGGLKQRLDEHLVRVAKQAVRVAHCLPYFSEGMERITDVSNLNRKSPKAFSWQDKAVTKIRDHRKDREKVSDNHEGWFVVNMAGTGCGKTFANAKIMQAISPDGRSLRYSLLLGLRSLTLQTGKEYRNRIGLDDSEMAVLVGAGAVKELYDDDAWEENSDTERMNELIPGELEADSSPENKILDVLLKSSPGRNGKNRDLLYAPVLVSTIDHIMPSVETVRGGRHILPFLRLMAADVVIDEIDDFTGKDLVAIARLVHMAGMLGRNVVISSATIPPDLAEGMFSAYWSGREAYARFFDYKVQINCAWCDEFQTRVQTMGESVQEHALEKYHEWHEGFAQSHNKKLISLPVKRCGRIVNCEDVMSLPMEERMTAYYRIMLQTIVELHIRHGVTDKTTGKKISFGLVRLANINPCVQAAKYFLESEWPQDIAPRVLVYHSRQTALLRSLEEKYLDAVLKRKEQDLSEIDFKDTVVRRHISDAKEQNIIFIVVATPVEELGRDHDFDWAVVEPSSYRSIIQLAGRILRHRNATEAILSGNIAIMQYNVNAIKQRKVAFCKPGFESNTYMLASHDMKKLLDIKQIAERIDAAPRTERSEKLHPHDSLIDLEHKVLADFRDLSKAGAGGLHGWQEEYWWLTGLPQRLNPFRDGQKDMELCLIEQDDGRLCFCEKDTHTGEWVSQERFYPRSLDSENERFWLKRDYQTALAAYREVHGENMGEYYVGILNVPVYDDEKDSKWLYSDQFGMYKSE